MDRSHHMPEKKSSFDSIPDTLEAFSRGEFVIVLDSTDRENEGDLIIAAEDVTTEKMAFMIRYTSGYVCVPVTAERAAALHLPQMVTHNTDPNRTAYTTTVDARGADVTTGISAQDRAHTCRLLASPDSTADSFRRPGHVAPLQARAGGVRERFGHTEAAIELCRLTGKRLAGAICELIRDGEEVPGRAELRGGGMMRRDDCLQFGRRWNLRACTIEELIEYVERREGKLSNGGAPY